MNKYSIIIPIHNEIFYIQILLDSLESYIQNGHEVIIIDDGSTDGSTQVLKKNKLINLITLKNNRGKGFAIKQGLKEALNNKIIIYDGDMELDPLDISKLMILDNKKNIGSVMGYRFNSLSPLKSNFDWGNFMFTTFFNIMFNSHHKDVLCCAKAFYLDSINNYSIKSDGFDIDAELTSILSILKNKKTILQIALKYNRRTFEEGKKLKVSDGWIILSKIIQMIKYL